MYISQVSGERLQDHWSSGCFSHAEAHLFSARNCGPYICPICAKLFKKRKGLYEHERRHEKRAPYLCCNKPFFSKANYTRHRCNIHGEQKKYQCSHCDLRFGIKSDLNQHLRIVVKNYHVQCDVCFKFFGTEAKLMAHSVKHLPVSVKKFGCDVCHKRFRFLSGLSRHKKKHSDVKV